MAYLAAKTEASRLTKLISQLEFTSMTLNNKRENITSKMNGRQATCNSIKTKLDKWNNTSADKRADLAKNDKWYVNNGLDVSDVNKTFDSSTKVKGVVADYSVDAQYLEYYAADDYLDTRLENIESQLTLARSQKDATDKLAQNGASQAGSLWCVGGGG